MIQTLTTGSNPLEKRRTYRRLMFGSIGVGVVGSVVLRSLDYPLLGEAVYLLAFVAFLAIWQGTSVTLFDERETYLEERASAITLTVFAFVLIGGASTLRILAAVDANLPVSTTMVEGALWALAAQFAVFGVVYLALRYRT